ncbi:DNA polymerase III subunit beta [Polycyclovorans algicola]|uniref:DNA polymerase III subunit beta n=1 Tax=Polycyclovorans algicola TaxID=616992 RepID=UPI0004A6E79A|nr:DNA polymerase III subunit beta [Polycyclovorans algicola]
MKITTNRNDLLAALNKVIGVVERRQTLPILSNLLAEVQDAELKLTGTDLEIEMETTVSVQNIEPGRITLPARKLFDLCRGLPESAAIELSVTGDRATLKSGRSRYTLACLSADDFSSLDSGELSQQIELPAAELLKLIQRTQFAMAQQDVRFYLNGMLLQLRPGTLNVVTTDGHRLALARFETTDDQAKQPTADLIVPRKAILELSRLLAQVDGNVVLHFNQGQIRVQVDSLRLTSKLIDGRFPEYERVIPQHSDKHLVLDRERFRQALARCSIFSNDKFKGVRLTLGNGTLTLQSNNPEHEEAEEVLDVDYQGEALEIGFNVVYLLDALTTLPGQNITLSLRNADSSGLMTTTEEPTLRYVVMPMRL